MVNPRFLQLERVTEGLQVSQMKRMKLTVCRRRVADRWGDSRTAIAGRSDIGNRAGSLRYPAVLDLVDRDIVVFQNCPRRLVKLQLGLSVSGYGGNFGLPRVG